MLLTKFDPFRDITEFEKRFYTPSSEGVSSFTPSVNTREGEFAYHIDADLPGVKKEDIKVDIHKDVLTISGERKTKEEVKEEDYYKVETSFGKFTRSFTLPDSVDAENIDANYEDGVLEVVIPKLKETANKKTIKVK